MKKIKANCSNIPSYIGYGRIKDTKRNIKGCYYIMEEKLTEEIKKELLNKYNNIEFMKHTYTYARELIDDVIVIYDRVLKNAY